MFLGGKNQLEFDNGMALLPPTAKKMKPTMTFPIIWGLI